MNPKVDFFFTKAKQWKDEYEKLREIALDCGLNEELKWGSPCYTFNKKNIVLIHGFKDYCAFLFFKGALLKDPAGILIRQTENVQAARQIRFTSVREVVKLRSHLKAYIREAVRIEEAGLKVEFKKPSEIEMAKEFLEAMKKVPGLRKAFYSLTPGRQRGYLLYFSSAKQAKTRETRVKKFVDKILDGKGLDD